SGSSRPRPGRAAWACAEAASAGRRLEVQRPALLDEADGERQPAPGGIEPDLDVELVVGALVDAPHPPGLAIAAADRHRRGRVDPEAHRADLARARECELERAPFPEGAAREAGDPPQLADQADPVLGAGRHRDGAVADRPGLRPGGDRDVACLACALASEGKMAALHVALGVQAALVEPARA